MKEKYIEKICKEGNDWIYSKDQYGLILTDDLDSLLSCSILKQIKGWNIEQVFLFKANKSKNIDYLGQLNMELHEAVGVDLALMNGKCFDNHLTAFCYGQKPNQQAINLNNLCNICRNSYKHKYNTSTVMLLWSLYDLPKENLSDEMMMLLLSIDGTQDAYYLYQGAFRSTLYKWLVEVLDLPEFYNCFERHCYNDFKEVRKKYNFDPKCSDHNGKIYVHNKGYLTTQIDIDGLNDLLAWDTDIQIALPEDKFYLKGKCEDLTKDISMVYPSSIEKICDGNVFSYAMTGKNYVNYSKIIETN